MMQDGDTSDELPQVVAGTLTRLRDEVLAHDGTRRHDALARRSILEAIDAGFEGNGAIGALLLDPAGNVVVTAHNRMFVPHFRSDFHAEMALLSTYEDANHDQDLNGYTMVTSLEPCEMCTIRIINSGLTRVIYVAADDDRSVLNKHDRLAPHWRKLAESQTFEPADCDPVLATIAFDAFMSTVPWAYERLMARRYPKL